MAGAGPSRGANAGSLGYYFAPVLPYRRGHQPRRSARFIQDGHDHVDVRAADVRADDAGHRGAGRGVSADIGVDTGPGCPTGDVLCGFKEGMSVLIFDAGDGSGAYDTFTITDAQLNVLHVERTGGSLTRTDYQPDTTTIVQVTSIVYSLKSDAVAGTYQLVSRDDAGGADVPVVDHLVALTFDYYGDPQPPATGRSLRDSGTTTYGPRAAGARRTDTDPRLPGRRELHVRDRPGERTAGRRGSTVLGASGSASALVPLTGTQLTDGPWCPDETNANRWDADLLRIRKIGVTLRVQSANAALRGPAGVLFAQRRHVEERQPVASGSAGQVRGHTAEPGVRQVGQAGQEGADGQAEERLRTESRHPAAG